MARPRSTTYAANSDLAWFDVQVYSGLIGRMDPETETSEERQHCLKVWAALIRDRVELARLASTGSVDLALRLFDRIKQDPSGALGFERRYTGPAVVGDTSAVKSLTLTRLKTLQQAIPTKGVDESAIVDQLIEKNEVGLSATEAHVMINLASTDDQLRKDFSYWLAARRSQSTGPTHGDYRRKIRSWHSQMFLAYHDLMLYSELHKKNISVRTRYQLLNPRSTEAELAEIDRTDGWRRKLDQRIREIFTHETAQTLEQLAVPSA